MSSHPQKYGLAIHTSSPELGLSISNFAGDSRQQVWNLGQDLSSQFHAYLAEFIRPQTWSDLEFIAVAKGPGGFTGTRIGVIVARTLAQQLKIPLYAISSLAAWAWLEYCQTPKNQLFPLQMQAQRGQLFTAIYGINTDKNYAEIWQKLECLNLNYSNSVCESFQLVENAQFTSILPDQVMSPEIWAKVLSSLELSDQFITLEGGLGKSVASLLELAYQQWQQGKRSEWPGALPFYGQHPVESPSP